jgi:hypothetical protein
MRRNLGVGVQRKPVDPGTAGARQCGGCTFITKPRPNAPHLLTGPLPEGEALRHGGSHGTGECGLVIEPGIISSGHDGINSRLQISQPTQCADDPPADLLDHVSCSAGADVGDVGIGGRLDLDEARLEACLGAIEVDSLQKTT